MRKAIPWIAIAVAWIIGITVFGFICDQTPRLTLSPESERVLHLRQIIESGRFTIEWQIMKFGPHLPSSFCEEFSYPIYPFPTTWDCDDVALITYDVLIGDDGINEGDIRILIGNLDIEDEEISECNHVWVICYRVTNEGWSYWMAYDWGERYCDEQHYEGYPITYEELLSAVEYDK